MDFKRYSRQIFMEEVSIEGQRKINTAKVLIIGAGGLGSPVIQYLAAAGVGKLGVVDFDDLEIHNLNRQVIHQEKFIGQPKVESARNFIDEFNSSIEFIPIHEKLVATNIQDLFEGYDLIVDCSDNFDTRYLINDFCVKLKIPLVYGSIFSFEGQVAIFNYKGSKSLRDLFPEAPKDEDIQNCDQFGVLGALPGIVGSMMAMLALKVIIELPVQSNLLTIIDCYEWKFTQIKF
ncbi:HesA/MoeB/ThiF family protein [Sphingobacterium endophyticum]|uniref:HesA/MoeB/ThiF family protein n=1 Tax=Sphingobacterium endophyticum TaxID=2546448 RepID=UPI0012E22772|nr:HesA/MoeB/ThiF family protein [Sphingobacterium endophyticum]